MSVTNDSTYTFVRMRMLNKNAIVNDKLLVALSHYVHISIHIHHQKVYTSATHALVICYDMLNQNGPGQVRTCTDRKTPSYFHLGLNHVWLGLAWWHV